MLAEERQQMILEMLKTNQFVKVQEICDQTHGSESSVRRDLQTLEEKGLLERVHGGAKLNYIPCKMNPICLARRPNIRMRRN